MKPIHDRMPVIVGDEDLAAWLGEESISLEAARKMLRPFAPERMNTWPVSKAVGNVRSQGPGLVEPA